MTSTKTWLITGASSGFGLAFANFAIDRGYNVVATARRVAKLEGLSARAPDRVMIAKMDVNDADDVKSAIAAAVARVRTH